MARRSGGLNPSIRTWGCARHLAAIRRRRGERNTCHSASRRLKSLIPIRFTGEQLCRVVATQTTTHCPLNGRVTPPRSKRGAERHYSPSPCSGGSSMRGTSLFTLFGCALAVVACSDPSPLEPGLIQPPEAPVFAKPVADPGPLWRLPLDDAGLGLVSDRRQQSGIFSVYEDGVCGVTGKIFTGGSGDATLQTNNPRQKNTTCQTARTMSLVYPTGDPVYPAGGVETMLVFVNPRNIPYSITTHGSGYET